jgi:hypothetical protein
MELRGIVELAPIPALSAYSDSLATGEVLGRRTGHERNRLTAVVLAPTAGGSQRDAPAARSRLVDRPAGSAPELDRRGRRDHWRRPLVNGVDDLGVIDPAEVRRGDPEIGVPELALDH